MDVTKTVVRGSFQQQFHWYGKIYQTWSILEHCDSRHFQQRNQRLWMFPNLEYLIFSYNKINGQVPGWLWKLSSLSSLDLSYNNLIGFERSTKHGLSPELQILDISNNKIKGQVPGWLWTLPSLYNLDFSNNNFISFGRSRKLGISSALQYFQKQFHWTYSFAGM